MRVDMNPTDLKLPTASSNNEQPSSQRVSSEKENVVKQSEKKEEQASFPGERKLIDAIEKASNVKMGDNTSLKFSIHEKTKQILVKIIDEETKEVVKEIPSEKIIDMIAEMCEKAGIFVDKKG